ncbi:hypothetical protein AB6A40_001197 [Gnathostoma spinigerum]|uniref:Uncharacterized protein n=1 Tax=Gnathostoma spinigerum TaxID=75299 RepID=A0ABD6ECF2_9BILA
MKIPQKTNKTRHWLPPTLIMNKRAGVNFMRVFEKPKEIRSAFLSAYIGRWTYVETLYILLLIFDVLLLTVILLLESYSTTVYIYEEEVCELVSTITSVCSV